MGRVEVDGRSVDSSGAKPAFEAERRRDSRRFQHMNHQLVFGKIHIIEWLRRPDRRSGPRHYCGTMKVLVA